MKSKKAEELKPGDVIDLFASLDGVITVKVKGVRIDHLSGEATLKVEEIDWCELVAPVDTEVDVWEPEDYL